MNRALVSDFQQLGALLLGKVAGERNLSPDFINRSLASLAVGALLCVNFRVHEPDLNARKWPALFSSVHSDRHRSTCPKGGE
jgi:hypothetical protein